MSCIYMTLHTKYGENRISNLQDFLHIFLLHTNLKIIILSQPSRGWISLKFGTLIKHILSLKFGDV